MRSIMKHISSNRMRTAARVTRQQIILQAMPDHLRRDIGLPERGPVAAISRRHNPYSW
jgi:hypothetical protein